MSKTLKPTNKRNSKRIPTLLECAGKPYKRKDSTQENPGRMWGLMGKEGRPFERPNGTISVDKTLGVHSRPGSKEKTRNANRSINKRARQILKRQIVDETNY